MAEQIPEFLQWTNICGQTVLKSNNYLTAQHCILFFTGNPSLLRLHFRFLTLLHEKYPDRSILVVSLHCTPMDPDVIPTWRTSLFDAVKVKLNLVDWVLDELPKTTRFTILTHSLGAFICCHILPQRPELEQRVDDIIHIFPAIRDLKNSIDWIVRFLSAHAIFYPFVAMITDFLKLWPVPMFKLFIQAVSTTPTDLVETMQEDLNPHHLAQVAYFTLDEEDIITTHDEPTVKCLNQTAKKTKVVFGTHDKYTPRWVIEEFKNTYKDIPVYETEVKHAFVLGQSQQLYDFLNDNGIL